MEFDGVFGEVHFGGDLVGGQAGEEELDHAVALGGERSRRLAGVDVEGRSSPGAVVG